MRAKRNLSEELIISWLRLFDGCGQWNKHYFKPETIKLTDNNLIAGLLGVLLSGSFFLANILALEKCRKASIFNLWNTGTIHSLFIFLTRISTQHKKLSGDNICESFHRNHILQAKKKKGKNCSWKTGSSFFSESHSNHGKYKLLYC